MSPSWQRWPATAATYTTLGRHNHKKRRRWRKACGDYASSHILTFGLIANLYIVGDVSAELVCGALLAICCAAVGEYARSSAWTIAILLMLDCGACFTPSWCAMMPVAAYNAAMLPAISQNVEQHRAGRNHAACVRNCRTCRNTMRCKSRRSSHDGCGSFP